MIRRVQPLLLALMLASCAGEPATTPSPAPAPPTIAAQLPTTAPTSAPAPSPTQPTSPPSPTPAPRYELVLLGGTLIDGSGGPPLLDSAVAIRDGTIAAVGRAGELAFAPGTPTRDVGGQTIMPGFVNVHAHTHTLTVDELRAWPRAGITTVRDLGGPRDAMLARSGQLATAGDPTLPRLLVAGPILTVPGGHPIPIYGLSDEVLALRDADQARAQAASLIEAGAQVIKIAVSGRTDVSWPELTDEQIAAIAEVARARGVRLAAHVDRASALRRAVEHGITDAAHMPRDRMPDELIALMVERGVVMSPTIDVYEALAEERGAGDAWRATTQAVMYDNLQRFVAAGGTLALGDDYGNPGVSLGMPMPEIRHWLAAGLTPMQMIVAATHGGAVACGLADQIGLVRPGYAADLLVVAGDPLEDIAALERVALVLRDGQIIQ